MSKLSYIDLMGESNGQGAIGCVSTTRARFRLEYELPPQADITLLCQYRSTTCSTAMQPVDFATGQPARAPLRIFIGWYPPVIPGPFRWVMADRSMQGLARQGLHVYTRKYRAQRWNRHRTWHLVPMAYFINDGTGGVRGAACLRRVDPDRLPVVED